MRRRRLTFAAVVLLSLSVFFFFVAAPTLDHIANRETGATHPPVSERARELHRKLWVADLHADSLMWNRDLSQRNARGLVDIPRLIEGGVALQAFTIVSKVPWGMNISSNSDSGDMLLPLLVAQRWPVRTWTSLLERAMYQAERLGAAARDSGGSFSLITTREGLARYRESRARDPKRTAGFLGIEGAQVLEGNFDHLGRLFAAGFRMLAPSHFFDTEVGGSAHGERKTGLTPLGRRVIQEMERIGMLVDLAHAAPRTIDDVLDMATRPVVFSHTGVVATCDNQRNVTDATLRRLAQNGGIVGIGFFRSAVCGEDLSSIVRAIRHVVDLIGAEHVALGSDFDGFVRTPVDAAELPALTDALLSAGFSPQQLERIMGGNVMDLLSRTLPAETGLPPAGSP